MDQYMSGSSELICSVRWNHRWYYACWLVHWSNSCIWSCCYRRIRVSQVSIKTSLYFVGSRWSWSDAGYGFWTWSQGDFKPNIIGLVSLLVFLCFCVCQCVCVGLGQIAASVLLTGASGTSCGCLITPLKFHNLIEVYAVSSPRWLTCSSLTNLVDVCSPVL
jgi:hypothetical protein